MELDYELLRKYFGDLDVINFRDLEVNNFRDLEVNNFRDLEGNTNGVKASLRSLDQRNNQGTKNKRKM